MHPTRPGVRLEAPHGRGVVNDVEGIGWVVNRNGIFRVAGATGPDGTISIFAQSVRLRAEFLGITRAESRLLTLHHEIFHASGAARGLASEELLARAYAWTRVFGEPTPEAYLFPALEFPLGPM